jgi:ABC-type nickel/cobalt efflux system permease component RcnA
MLAATVAGLTAGLIHVLSGPDHLAAIAPLATDERRRAWRAGLLWGLGHSSGVLVVGLLALWLRDRLPLDGLSAWSERLVGVVLIGVGLWGLRRAFARRVHAHPHVHGPVAHDHAHVHGHDQHAVVRAERPGHAHTHAAFAIGILHGIAGSSHVIAVLPALALPGVAASLGYLGGYGTGTVAGMSGFAFGIGLLGRSAVQAPARRRWLLSASSAAAIVVGVVWLGG